MAGAAPGAAPEPERGSPRHAVDVVGLGAREPGEAAARVPDVIFMDYGVNDAAAIYNAFVPGSAGTGPAIEALSREAKRRCPATALVHIEGAWNHGEKTREPTVPRLADAQRAVAARYGGIIISFIAGTCYQKTGVVEARAARPSTSASPSRSPRPGTPSTPRAGPKRRGSGKDRGRCLSACTMRVPNSTAVR